MKRITYDKETLENIIDKLVDRTKRMDMTWDWPCGVAYYGIAEAYEATVKKEYLEFLKERIN